MTPAVKKKSYELCNKRIESIHEVEKFIAIKNEKLQLHEIKWSMYNMNQIASLLKETKEMTIKQRS